MKKITSDPIVIVHSFNAEISRVWETLTDTEDTEQCIFNIKVFKLEFEYRIDD